MQGGPHNLQVFSDFEHVFTKFKNNDGNKAFTTSELLESSGAISSEALQQIHQIHEEYEKLEELDDASFSEMSSRLQNAVARHGNLHISTVPAVTRFDS